MTSGWKYRPPGAADHLEAPTEYDSAGLIGAGGQAYATPSGVCGPSIVAVLLFGDHPGCVVDVENHERGCVDASLVGMSVSA